MSTAENVAVQSDGCRACRDKEIKESCRCKYLHSDKRSLFKAEGTKPLATDYTDYRGLFFKKFVQIGEIRGKNALELLVP